MQDAKPLLHLIVLIRQCAFLVIKGCDVHSVLRQTLGEVSIEYNFPFLLHSDEITMETELLF